VELRSRDISSYSLIFVHLLVAWSQLVSPSIRRFIVWSSVPPVDSLYRAAYWGAIFVTLLSLWRYRSIVAIYVSRSCATGRIKPGISDIDFNVVTTDDSTERDSIRATFILLNKLSAGLIDYYPRLVQTIGQLKTRWNTTPVWQYRYVEGQTSWKLVRGSNVLAGLPELTKEQYAEACYAEVVRWWFTFALNMRQAQSDVILRNSICYKAVSELLNAEFNMRNGTHGRTREQGLELKRTPLTEKLASIAAQNFLPPDDMLMEETMDFLITSLIDLWQGFSERPFVQSAAHIRQSVDCHEEEFGIDESVQRMADVWRQRLKSRWGEKICAMHLIKSAFWNLDEFLLMIDASVDALPDVQQLLEVFSVHDDVCKYGTPKIWPYLRVGQVAFALMPQTPKDLTRSVLTPFTTPDVFLQLGETTLGWTGHTSWYLSQWQTNERWTDASPTKQLQLRIIAEGAVSGEVVYPLTEAAVQRAAKRLDRQGGKVLTGATS